MDCRDSDIKTILGKQILKFDTTSQSGFLVLLWVQCGLNITHLIKSSSKNDIRRRFEKIS